MALLALATAHKGYLSVKVARAFDISAEHAWALLSMRTSERFARSVAGYEMAFLGYASTAILYRGTFAVLSLMLVLRAHMLRRQAALLDYVEELERRVQPA